MSSVIFPAAQTCALLSTFVCDEKSSETPKLSEELTGPLRQMMDIARRIARVSHECKLEVSHLVSDQSLLRALKCHSILDLGNLHLQVVYL